MLAYNYFFSSAYHSIVLETQQNYRREEESRHHGALRPSHDPDAAARDTTHDSLLPPNFLTHRSQIDQQAALPRHNHPSCRLALCQALVLGLIFNISLVIKNGNLVFKLSL